MKKFSFRIRAYPPVSCKHEPSFDFCPMHHIIVHGQTGRHHREQVHGDGRPELATEDLLLSVTFSENLEEIKRVLEGVCHAA